MLRKITNNIHWIMLVSLVITLLDGVYKISSNWGSNDMEDLGTIALRVIVIALPTYLLFKYK